MLVLLFEPSELKMDGYESERICLNEVS